VAQLVVRELENDVKARLQRRARQHGRSMEDEVRNILRQAVATERRVVRKLGSRIAERFRETGLTADLPELSGQAARPAAFDGPLPPSRRDS
jgi:plasmid stability protein